MEHADKENAVALMERTISAPMPLPDNVVQITPAQARVESVAAALDAAYRQASSLHLTAEESSLLAEDFPDEAFSLGAGGDPNLVYIEHAYLRQRLNKVLGIGAVVPIRRREWAEDSGNCVRVYVDMVLLVRGALVAEAVADGVYWKNNAKTTYSDALESAMSNAFRRLCKQFGVGLQAWMKGWCEEWKSRQRGNPAGRVATRQTTSGHHPANKTPPASNSEAKQANPADVPPKKATETRRKGVLDFLRGHFSEQELLAFAEDRQFLVTGADKILENWRLENVPVSNAQLNELTAEIGKWLEPPAPSELNGEELTEPFWDVVIHIPPKGQKRAPYLAGTPDTIRSLYLAGKSGNKEAANRLFGFSENFTPQPYNGRISEDDVALRDALDQFVQWREERQQTLTSELRQAAQTDPDPNNPAYDDVPF